ncbi:hypothetical protein F5J12DRAFT_782727 [Pisolithus orientalis]|uniref:uncharacterized protein n=1 Tax=Pisolithus orientalis TaxID=936130 RepID=UPI002224EBCF|nr:uncharacterized protein F5J12DRAFT_782727 [Pisolithus orientalis]KAI6007733.1 hypothetical protein F5J12DRAFT_782727 [Pisolithus orientalis]
MTRQYFVGQHLDDMTIGNGTRNQWNRCKKTKHDSTERRLAERLQRPLQGLTQASGYHCRGCAFQRFSESKLRWGEDEEGPGTAIRHGGDTIGGLWVLEIGLEVEGVARVASLLGGEEASFHHWVRLKPERSSSLSAKAEGSLIAGMGIPDVIIIGTNWGTRSDAAGVEEQK